MVKMALDRLKDHENERRASLMDLEAEVRLAQQALERHRSRTIDHVGKLPIELFGEVARIVVEDDQSALVTLLHVCRHWRAVVESSPQLWRTLVLTWRKPKQKAKLWIERSKGHLHELIIRETVDDSPHLAMRFTYWSPVGAVAEAWVDGIESRALLKEHRRISMSLQPR